MNKIITVIIAGFVLAALAPTIIRLLDAVVPVALVIGGVVIVVKLVNYYTRF